MFPLGIDNLLPFFAGQYFRQLVDYAVQPLPVRYFTDIPQGHVSFCGAERFFSEKVMDDRTAQVGCIVVYDTGHFVPMFPELHTWQPVVFKPFRHAVPL